MSLVKFEVIKKAIERTKVELGVLQELIDRGGDNNFAAQMIDAKTQELTALEEKYKEAEEPKFILIISKEIDRYLEWASAAYLMHKSRIVRDAIEDRMSGDKEYKKDYKLHLAAKVK